MQFLLEWSALISLIFLASSSSALVPSRSSNAAGQAACAQLSKLLGQKVSSIPLDPAYIQSTKKYFSSEQAQNKPSCVVGPTSYSDVQTAVKVIRQFNSTLAVKAGGHQTNNYWSSTAGGVLIDLINMRTKTYDSSTQTGYYQPGNKWADLYPYYENLGVIPVGGRIADVGSGLSLGGGLSYLSGQYGLACDSFKALDVVLINGTLVQATATNQYKDLFFSLKGGGNQFGIVVGYTVDVYPIGDTWGGVLIYGSDQFEAVYESVLKFTNENKDPKAAVIGTLEIIGLPSVVDVLTYPVLKGLTQFILLFNVYNGPDGTQVFKQFTDIPHILDTRQKQPYNNIANIDPVGNLSIGSVSFRAGSHSSTSSTASATLKQALDDFLNYADQSKGTYDVLSFDMQPVPASLVQASRAKGGNAQDSVDGPYYWLNYLHSTTLGYPNAQKSLADFKTMVEKTPNDPSLPIFLNDANADQPILQSYRAFDKLKAAKAVYDPDNYLSTHMGGPSFA